MDPNQYKLYNQTVAASTFEVINGIKSTLANVPNNVIHIRDDILRAKLDKIMKEIVDECFETVYTSEVVSVCEYENVYETKHECSNYIVTDGALSDRLLMLTGKYGKDRLIQLLDTLLKPAEPYNTVKCIIEREETARKRTTYVLDDLPAIEIHDVAQPVTIKQEIATKQTNYTLHDLPDYETYINVWEEEEQVEEKAVPKQPT